jgi:hypothetical protein
MSDEYRQAMKALARDTSMAPTTAARIEQELLDALADPDAANVRSPSRIKRLAWRRSNATPMVVSWRPWIAAAAAVVLVAAALLSWSLNQPTVTDKQDVSPDASRHTSPPTVEKATTPQAVVPSAADATPRPGRRKNTTQRASVVRPSGFIELPGADGLPAFESGEIVRMEVPVATLPTYGIDISSGSAGRPVEADILIGQDGFARAIRLVTSTARSTQ